MPHSYEEIYRLALELPTEQRLILAGALWESVEPAEAEVPEAEVAAAWDDEIKRRLDEIDSEAVEMIPLEEVLADMDAQLARKRRG
jgi:putative addiction module component (TIGR02574 family)